MKFNNIHINIINIINIIIIIIIIIVLLFYIIKNKKCVRNSKYITLLKKRINSQNILLDTHKQFIFCSNNNYYLSKIVNNSVFLRHNKDYLITNKKTLYITLKKYYPQKVHQIVPLTFIFPEDYHKYHNYKKRNPNDKIIYKTLSHKQEGLFISNNTFSKKFIASEKFILGQIFVLDSLKYKESKVSFRLYLIVSCVKGKFKSYYFNDGLVYYSLDGEIASFYDSDSFYKKDYPILISQFSKKTNKDIISKMVDKMKMLSMAIEKEICVSDNNYYYELYGVDFQLTSNLDAYILEVNAGPGMTANNNTDKILRNNIFDSFITLINNNKINSNLNDIIS
jgi:hypothetical protein